jgi:class 3 adenylate cyclase/pimeloyl-ACP methyl ester carboxylesterase
MDVPESRYVRAPDGTSIAYQVIGGGSVDIVYSAGVFSNVEMMWEIPEWERFLRRLGSFSRLVAFDMRGVGLSDRGPERPTIELQRDDITAVMDAVGVRSGIVFGHSRSASMAMLFAATHPERTKALILYSPVAKSSTTPDFQHGMSSDELKMYVDRMIREMGTGRILELWAPSVAADERFVKRWARFERLVASPSAFEELARVLTEIDLRDVLPAIHVPTLVLHRDREAVNVTAQARDVAERIDGAIYVELPGVDLLPFVGDADAVLDVIEEFVTGVRPVVQSDRVLATVLFTDIVGSTEVASRLGDSAWKDLLAIHDERAKSEIERFRGTYVASTGDGLLATFDGPARGVRCAQALVEAVKPLGIQIRVGLHTGEVHYGGHDLAGVGVHIGARVGAMAGTNEVWVSSTVKDLTVGSGLTFEDAGEHELKGVPDRWHLYRVVS